MTDLTPTDLGALARRLREDAGLGTRALADALAVTFSAVARAERGDPALHALAERAVAHLLGREPGGFGEPGVVRDGAAPYRAAGDAGDAAVPERVRRLLDVERGWRRALVRGVLGEHGFDVAESGGARLTARTAAVVLRFDLDRFVVTVERTPDGGTPDGRASGDEIGAPARLCPLPATPYDRADRAAWGEALERLAAFYGDGASGWAEESDDDFGHVLAWTIDADEPLGSAGQT